MQQNHCSLFNLHPYTKEQLPNESVKAALPVPLGFKTASPLDQPDIPPVRSNSLEQGTVRANELQGAGKAGYDSAVYYEKLGRNRLKIKLSGVVGGEEKVKELLSYMHKGTNVAY